MSHTTDETGKDPEKKLDLPPYGPRNPDPITDAPGSHPIETGIGALIGGAVSGLAVGTLTAGPVGAIVGAIVGGAAAGGLAGKGIGELIDPTTEDNWIREFLASQRGEPDYDEASEPAMTEAYRFGLRAAVTFRDQTFDQCEPTLKKDWELLEAHRPWSKARGPAREGFERARALQHGHADDAH